MPTSRKGDGDVPLGPRKLVGAAVAAKCADPKGPRSRVGTGPECSMYLMCSAGLQRQGEATVGPRFDAFDGRGPGRGNGPPSRCGGDSEVARVESARPPGASATIPR